MIGYRKRTDQIPATLQEEEEGEKKKEEKKNSTRETIRTSTLKIFSFLFKGMRFNISY